MGDGCLIHRTKRREVRLEECLVLRFDYFHGSMSSCDSSPSAQLPSVLYRSCPVQYNDLAKMSWRYRGTWISLRVNEQHHLPSDAGMHR